MRIFLTSQASKTMGKIATMLPQKPSNFNLAFIPTAGDPYGDDKPWMDADRKMLVDLGFKVEDFDLKNKTPEQTRETLKKFDVLFVAGGNTFYLLNEANKSGFTKIAKEMVQNGTIYIGSSAGSYLACPTIEASGWKRADRNIVGIVDLKAIGLVDYIVIAHYEPKWVDAVEEGKKTTDLKVYTLTDQQFINSSGGDDAKVLE